MLQLIEQINHILQEQQKLLEEQLRLAKKRHFGQSSEKQLAQGNFFDEAELEVALGDIEAELPQETPARAPRKKREGFSEKPPRVQIHLYLSDEERAGASKTSFTTVKEEGRPATSDEWMWLIRGGPPDRPVVLFECAVSRSETVPSRLLDGLAGVPQTDGYAGYDQACRENSIIRIGCWDHARRRSLEASQTARVQENGQKVSKADVAIGKSQELYAIEDSIEDLKPEQKTIQRPPLSQPVLNGLKGRLRAGLLLSIILSIIAKVPARGRSDRRREGARRRAYRDVLAACRGGPCENFRDNSYDGRSERLKAAFYAAYGQQSTLAQASSRNIVTSSLRMPTVGDGAFALCFRYTANTHGASA